MKDFAYSVDLTETLKFADEKFTYDDVSYFDQRSSVLCISQNYMFIAFIVRRIMTMTCTIRWTVQAIITMRGTSKKVFVCVVC